jgi:class 3 adenylate cyclase
MRRALVLVLLSVSPFAGASSIHGVFDLTHWDGRSPVPLDGVWTFWPNSSAVSASVGLELPVPGSWNSVMHGADGWGTYRATVQLANPSSDLALALPVINSAATVLWNGAVVWSVGSAAGDREHFVGGRRTGVVTLHGESGDNVLEIRVASWGDITAGLTESLRLGTVTGLLEERNSAVTLTVFVFGCLLVMGVYHVGMFLYRRSDRGPLWFGSIALLLAVRGLVFGPCFLMDLLPGLSWEVLMKLGYLTFSATALVFALFIRDLFPTVAPRWFGGVNIAVSGTYALANLVLPAAWYSPALPLYQAFVGVLGIVVVYILVRAAIRKDRGGRLFLVGFVLFFLTVVHDILKTNFFIPTPFLASWGLLVFLIFQSLVMLRQFTAAFADSERYSLHLARLNLSLERFIPREVLSFLQKESIVEIELGDHGEYPMSVMFVDIRDFTTLSETMTPEENFRFINSYLRRVGPVIRANQGFVDKYMGDGIMALFPGDVRHAFEAALGIRHAVVEYNADRAKSGYPPIRIGIGIHRGPLMLGTIGENQRMDSTVISDTVNAASRLEGLTKKFGRDVLVSGETVEALGMELAARYQLEYLAEETVKGRVRQLKVYELGVRSLGDIDRKAGPAAATGA